MTDSVSENAVLPYGPKPLFCGRRRIYSKYSEPSSENIVEIISNALPDFNFNRGQMDYLWKYYRGVQPILHRVKDVRPEICNRIVENHAQECVSFKIGYQLSDPIQYISRTGKEDERTSEAIKTLNDMMFSEDKSASDHDLFEWLFVEGVGYRMVDVDRPEDYEKGGAPFRFHVLDPRCVFTVYSPLYDHQMILNVVVSKDADGNAIYDVYSKNHYWKIVNASSIASEDDNFLGLHIVEYCLNNARMGVFEPVLPLLDAINAIESNRLDGVEQTVQSLMKFIDCDINEDGFLRMLKLGAVKVSTVNGAKGDIDVLKNELDQTQTQVTKDDLYQAFLNITGMPDRNGSGASDTGAAVLLRDGWTLAESHAKSYELQFKKAERDFLRAVLKVCDASDSKKYDRVDIRLRDIDMAFNRRNYDNLLTRVQAFSELIGTGKVHPLLVWQITGLVTDPDAAYIMSQEYIDEQQDKASAIIQTTEVEKGTNDGMETAASD